MGTRTIIVFSETENEVMDEGVPIYKHFDGYPSNVLHLLRDYIYVNKGRLGDVGYFACGFIRYVENYGTPVPELFKDRTKDDWKLNDYYTGYGLYPTKIDKELFNGFEDYYYKVTPKTIYVFKYSFEHNNLQKMYEVKIDDLLKMPDEQDYFEDLEKEIFKEFYGDDY